MEPSIPSVYTCRGAVRARRSNRVLSTAEDRRPAAGRSYADADKGTRSNGTAARAERGNSDQR